MGACNSPVLRRKGVPRQSEDSIWKRFDRFPCRRRNTHCRLHQRLRHELPVLPTEKEYPPSNHCRCAHRIPRRLRTRHIKFSDDHLCRFARGAGQRLKVIIAFYPIDWKSTQSLQVSNDVIDIFRRKTILPSRHVRWSAVQDDHSHRLLLLGIHVPEHPT